MGWAAPLLVLLFGASKHNPLKNREGGGVSALGGCQSMMQHYNQPKVGRSDGVDVSVEARVAGSTEGVHHPIVWGVKLSDKKINNIKCIVAFGRPYQ